MSRSDLGVVVSRALAVYVSRFALVRVPQLTFPVHIVRERPNIVAYRQQSAFWGALVALAITLWCYATGSPELPFRKVLP